MPEFNPFSEIEQGNVDVDVSGPSIAVEPKQPVEDTNIEIVVEEPPIVGIKPNNISAYVSTTTQLPVDLVSDDTNSVVAEKTSDVQTISESKQATPEVVESKPEVVEQTVIEQKPIEQKPVIETKSENKIVQDTYGTPEQREAAKRNSISNSVVCMLGDETELNDSMEKDYESDNRPDAEKINNPSNYIVKGYASLDHGFRTKNQKLLSRFITALENNNVILEEAMKELRISKLSASSIMKNSLNLDGTAGSLAVIAATQGLYKIRLYNSGFTITVRPLTMEMADEFIQCVDREFTELGRILGGFYHLPVGVMLKQKIADILPEIVVNSNLINWRDSSVLLNAISYNDYDTILWALSTMLYRDGIGIGLICTNPNCRKTVEDHFIDLAKACYLNLNKLNAEAVTWMMNSNAKRSLDDLKHYREDILGNKREYTPKGSELTYVFKEPSLQTYISNGNTVIGKLSSAINGSSEKINDNDSADTVEEKEAKNQRIRTKQFGLQLYRMLIPWISELRIKDGAKYITITGYEAISASLESRNNNDKLYTAMEDFMRDSKCSYYCANHLECPHCHKKLSFTKNDLVPIDIEYIFFFLSCLMLEQAGLEI